MDMKSKDLKGLNLTKDSLVPLLGHSEAFLKPLHDAKLKRKRMKNNGFMRMIVTGIEILVRGFKASKKNK